MTNDQELWAVALWVEKHHGEAGVVFTAQQIERVSGDLAGIAMWSRVGERLALLRFPAEHPSERS